MSRRAGVFVTRRPRLVLLAALVFLVLSAVFGADATGRLKTQGYDDPRSESSRAALVAAERLGASPNLVVVAEARGGSVDDPAARAAGEDLTRLLAAQPQVSAVTSYWTGGAPELRGRDGRAAMLVAHVDGEGEQLGARVKQLGKELTGPAASTTALTVHAGGTALVDAELQDLSESDLKRAESVVLPGTLILLVLVFGSVVAAALPLLIGVLAIAGTLLVLSALGAVTDVSVFALNLTTALGLGLGIDYGLLVVSRFREELALGYLPRNAAIRTVRTAGHTIGFSAATVSAALATLLVFPPYFLRSFAYAGIAVVAIAAVSAMTVLPALLALLGHRVNAWAVPWRRRVRQGSGSRFWEGLARIVVRRPLLAALPVIGLLAVLAGPFAHAGFATPDDRALPVSTAGRQTGDLVRGAFDMKGSSALTVVLTGAPSAPAQEDYARRLSALPQVAQVGGPGGSFRNGEKAAASASAGSTAVPAVPAVPAGDGTSLLSVVPLADPQSRAAQKLVHDIRATPAPAGGEVLVGGPSAVLVDAKDTVGDRIPPALSVITLTTFVLLLGFTRSLLLPLKAIALNALSLVAVLGAMVWIFQSGHLRDLLGFTPGPLSTTMPVLLFCIVFGLSVDYEVFVLARIKEAHEAGEDNAGSIISGIAHTGGIVTTAGSLLAFTLLSFGTSRVSLLQFFGIGAGLGVLLDATLVRGVLVPALMRLAGDLNWWAPRLLRRKVPRPAPPPPPVTAGRRPPGRCPPGRIPVRTAARAHPDPHTHTRIHSPVHARR
ncbi:efflux RND transporter permease subunit [Streptomyces sp. ISL-94]|uniref:MMPL family transporter n=1 Tax=Streptomyces sp. ISL-94 TaxID=2819190 RepID=UPI001BE5A8BE|nr:MMPL family transporter [Streptomyces sp. ISL-94]MBT2479928.1 MMPL family transporter [Streptomyces sp. ISL-94]